MRQWAVIGVLAAATSAWADGYRNPPDGALALGQIGGRIVDIDDATAVSHNPANLADLREITVEPAVTIGYSETRFTDLQGNHTTSEDPWRVLPSVYGAVPIKPGYLTLGVGVSVPYGQSTRWDENSLFRYTTPYYASMQVVDVSPAIGAQITDRISVGVGLDLYRGDVKFEQFIPWSMVTKNAATPDGVMKFTGDGYAVGQRGGGGEDYRGPAAGFHL
jgi:long-subunit fatty acid transport protein